VRVGLSEKGSFWELIFLLLSQVAVEYRLSTHAPGEPNFAPVEGVVSAVPFERAIR
jgi:hypothetical protein